MDRSLGQLQMSMPKELLKHMESESKPARTLDSDFIVYVPKVKVAVLEENKIQNLLKEGYERMADINLNISEMGLEDDLCCLESYEDILRDESDGR